VNNAWTNSASLVGRSLLALIFIVSGFGKITGFAGTAAYMTSKGLPFAEVLLVGAIAVEFLGGVLLVAGYKARWAAAAIFLFIIPTTIVFHNPMGLSGQEAQTQMINVMKNLAIMGGMLMLMAFGPGAWSADRR
jgi:putative oxidoreductase